MSKNHTPNDDKSNVKNPNNPIHKDDLDNYSNIKNPNYKNYKK